MRTILLPTPEKKLDHTRHTRKIRSNRRATTLNDHISHTLSPQTLSQHNHEFYSRAKETPPKRPRLHQQFTAYCIKQTVYIEIETNFNKAFKIFETINSRCIGLNPTDLLKNLLFKNVKKKDFNKVTKKWKEQVIDPLEHKGKQSAGALQFLRYYLMANITNIRQTSF